MTREEAAAATAERFARQRQERIEDVEFLLEQRTDPALIAERLGLSPAALAKSLYRSGRPDLANRFQRVVGQNRTPGVCKYCGGPTCRRERKSCTNCGHIARMETIIARSNAA